MFSKHIHFALRAIAKYHEVLRVRCKKYRYQLHHYSELMKCGVHGCDVQLLAYKEAKLDFRKIASFKK